MNAILTIVQFILVPILLIAALAVRFAGNAKPLNFVDYRKVGDASALHRWAGNRLLILPLLLLISGLLSLWHTSLAWLLFGVVVVLILIVATWLGLGAERFQR